MLFLSTIPQPTIPHLTRHIFSLCILIVAVTSGIFARRLPFPQQSVLGESVRKENISPAFLREDMSQLREDRIGFRKAQEIEKKTIKPVAKQIDEHTWTVSVPSDTKNASAQEVLQALNEYRLSQGRGALALDGVLAFFAQSRASMFASNGETDTHAGFRDLISSSDGFQRMGFMALGENSSYGYQVSGVKLIEEVYAADAPHNDNQLNSEWTHVGIGVAGVATDLVFGGRKM